GVIPFSRSSGVCWKAPCRRRPDQRTSMKGINMVFRRRDSRQLAHRAGPASSAALARLQDATPRWRPTTLAMAVGCALAGLAATSAPVQAWAAETVADARVYAIPAGRLSDVLAQFAATSGVLLSFDPQLLAGMNSGGLQGSYSVSTG